ncbi:hypothetical protein [Scytonema sp. NUACC26]|uniref:hypothetical protein n=1 Tax=Scytonema sp. NUACC26 TaxID=3140176 RepID=UPI0034DCB5E6
MVEKFIFERNTTLVLLSASESGWFTNHRITDLIYLPKLIRIVGSFEYLTVSHSRKHLVDYTLRDAGYVLTDTQLSGANRLFIGRVKNDQTFYIINNSFNGEHIVYAQQLEPQFVNSNWR